MRVEGSRVPLHWTDKSVSRNGRVQRGVSQRDVDVGLRSCGFSITLKSPFPPFSFLAIWRTPGQSWCQGSLLDADGQFQAVQKQSETLACSPIDGWSVTGSNMERDWAKNTAKICSSAGFFPLRQELDLLVGILGSCHQSFICAAVVCARNLCTCYLFNMQCSRALLGRL